VTTSRLSPRRATLRMLASAACCLAALSACSSSPAAPAALPACHAAEAAVLPHTAGSLTQADSGAYCLRVGQTLDVFLTAPTSSGASGPLTRWSNPKITDTSVLGYGNNGMVTPTLDVTPGVVVGLSRGETTVTSTLAGGKTWTATIVVS
jgi:hypothetical protein